MTAEERNDAYVTLHHEDIHFKDEESEKAFYNALAERKSEWTEHEALDYIITYVGTATFGKGRWFRQSDGTYYDRLFEDYVDLEEVAKRLVHTVWKREEE